MNSLKLSVIENEENYYKYSKNKLKGKIMIKHMIATDEEISKLDRRTVFELTIGDKFMPNDWPMFDNEF